MRFRPFDRLLHVQYLPSRGVHAIACSALLCVGSAMAEQPSDATPPIPSAWGIGAAVLSSQAAYKGVDREYKALPMLSYENQYVKISGPNVALKVLSAEPFAGHPMCLGVVAQLFGSGGYEAGDSPALAGMDERKSSVWAGAQLEWKNPLADLKLEWLGDASGNSKGQRIVLGLEHQWMLGANLMLVPKAGAEWVDKKYVDYYYGVRAGEANTGRAAYAGKATVNPELSLTAIYRFDRHQSLMLNAGVKSLGKEIKDSPLVDRTTENRVMLGYLYRF